MTTTQARERQGNDAQGHRERLRARFLKDMGASMADYELLELLLMFARPRVDVKPAAKRLIAEFRSLAGVLSAPPERLRKVPGVKDGAIAMLKATQQSGLRLLQDQAQRESLSSFDAVLNYCRAAMSHEAVEQFRLLFLDNRNALIMDEVQQRGTINHAPVYPREVAKRALDLGAAAIIMVHNHPGGDPTPSQADINTTREVRDICEQLDIRLHDHIIVGRGKPLSLRSAGYL